MEDVMPKPRSGAPGTTDQLPRWEGPPENRPAGYLPAEDDPAVDRDAAGENLQDPPRSDLSDAMTTGGDSPSREERIRTRAHQLWDQCGQQSGRESEHWYQAEREIDAEADSGSDIQPTSGAGPALAAHSKDAQVEGRARKQDSDVEGSET
jgi:hypothetical protein